MKHPIILTDIEGTTSSITFVKDVLFPYARERLPSFLESHAHESGVRAEMDKVADESGLARDDIDAIARTLQQWIDEDRKATPLKTLQGMIWRDGYENGAFKAHVYDDSAPALRRWKDEGRALYVYSSGSIAAQKLFFAHSEAGDLTPLFSGYFDTTSGGKREAQSYARIAAAIGAMPGNIVFLSDIVEELDAAAEAGLATRWLRRDAAPGEDLGTRHHPARSFAELDV